LSEDVSTLTATPAPARTSPPVDRPPIVIRSPRPRVGLSTLAIGIFLLSRLLTTAGIIAAHWVSGLSLRLIVVKWDAHWYLSIAQHGYPTGAAPLPGDAELRLAFLPLFPLMLRPLTGSGANAVLVATAVGTVFGLAATVAVAHLARHTALVMGAGQTSARRVALRTTAVFACFPGAIVLSLAYTEGLTLVLAVGCLLALLHRRWLLAGICAAFATAARPNALALVVACGWASYQAVRQRGEWRSLVAPLLAPVGFLSYLIYLQVHVGDWRAWHEVQARGWHQNIDFSLRLLRLLSPPEIVKHAARTDWHYFSIVAGLIFVLVAGRIFLRWRPPGVLTGYTVGVLAFCFLSSNVGPRPRMVLLALPLFLACGAQLRGRPYAMLLSCCAVCTVAMSYFVSMGRVIP